MDSVLLKCGKIDQYNALLAVVCDGVGSLSNGGYASGVAVKLLSEWFDQVITIDRIGLEMRDAILRINTAIVSEARRDNIDTASTLSALLLIEDNYYIVHIGDSRVYCYENETLSILTNDDVSETGKLTAYIGRTEEIFPQYLESTAVDKAFLVCSDGLYKGMDTDFLKAKMSFTNKRLLKEALDVLPQFVIERGEQDNISLALVKIEG
jgi:serine/threonine protein phosphatase PrpC